MGARVKQQRAPDHKDRDLVPDVPAHVEVRDGWAVIVPDRPIPPLTVEETRAATDRVRR